MDNDDVEFAEVGVFTQAMNVARQEVMREDGSASKRRRTRRQAQRESPWRVTLNKPTTSTTSKARKRIIVQKDSSDDE